ncbi:MAG: IS4 family transposase [Pirellulaceae bacterium]|nr:MAG: IS4 family transposase [Pirellulaceae bacterium]
MVVAWVAEEFKELKLGDKRLDKRFLRVMSGLAGGPNRSIPETCRGKREVDAAYELFKNPKVTPEKVLEAHLQATKQRISQEKRVVVAQDTTELDLTRPEQQVAGVGYLDNPARRGLYAHIAHAFTCEGVPLGTTFIKTWTRSGEEWSVSSEERRKKRKAASIETKESYRWIEGFRAVAALAQECPNTEFVCVADSEADIYQLFLEHEKAPGVLLLVRACHNRVAKDDSGNIAFLKDFLNEAPVCLQYEVLVREREAKTTCEKRPRRQSRLQRKAVLEVRAASVTLQPPKQHSGDCPAIRINAVLVCERDAPAGEEPVEWILLTNFPIDTAQQVAEVVDLYCLRWQIEVYFRTLKEGCRVEKRRFEYLDRYRNFLAVAMVLAWRVLYLSRMGDTCPDISCEAIFEPSEWKAVWTVLKGEPPPAEPPKVNEMVRMVARLGGYVDYKNRQDRPGPQTLWRGLQRMSDLSWGWDVFGPEARSG